MGRFSRCSSLAREFSRLVVGPSAWGEPLGRFSSLGGFIPSFRRDPGRELQQGVGALGVLEVDEEFEEGAGLGVAQVLD